MSYQFETQISGLFYFFTAFEVANYQLSRHNIIVYYYLNTKLSNTTCVCPIKYCYIMTDNIEFNKHTLL